MTTTTTTAGFTAGLTTAYAGLDLAAGGKDYSTLCIAEQYAIPTGEKRHWIHTGERFEVHVEHYVVVGLYRWPQGTDPGDVLRDTARLLDLPQFAWARLRYDATGLGAGVRSIVRDLQASGHFPAGVHAVTITGGQQSEHGTPKVDLVSRLSRLLHEQRLHVLDVGELAKAWRVEMQAFQAKVTVAGNIRYEAESESVHDDLVMATALAVNRKAGYGQVRVVNRQYFEHTILTGEE